MQLHSKTDISNFYVIGVSYKKASIEIRERFALLPATQDQILAQAKADGIEEMTILSTCNRTEIYAKVPSAAYLKKLITANTKGTIEEFDQCYFQYKGKDALMHMFYVASGMDSQIIGDSQIISQFRSAFKLSEKMGVCNSFLMRLQNILNQTNKRIKNETSLSSGTASVAYTAVQYIIKHCKEKKANILLIGAGKIGTITCVNLLKHMNDMSVTIINRNKERSKKLAEKLNLTNKNFAYLSEEANKANIIIVATGADSPTLLDSHLDNETNDKIILDLSVPRNADPKLAERKNINLVTIDELSVENEETLAIRKAAIAPAKEIIKEQLAIFYEWLEVQELSPTFQSIKKELFDIRQKELNYHQKNILPEQEEIIEQITQNIINKVARKCINYLKENKSTKSSPQDIMMQIFNTENQ